MYLAERVDHGVAEAIAQFLGREADDRHVLNLPAASFVAEPSRLIIGFDAGLAQQDSPDR